jgi:hypothetical protein
MLCKIYNANEKTEVHKYYALILCSVCSSRKKNHMLDRSMGYYK